MTFLKAERNKCIHTHATLLESRLSIKGSRIHSIKSEVLYFFFCFMKESRYKYHDQTKIRCNESRPSFRQKPNAIQSEISETQDFIKSLIKKRGSLFFHQRSLQRLSTFYRDMYR